MKKHVLIFIFFFCTINVFANESFYWIELKDKKGTEFKIEEPEKFLSKKAIERRKKYNISINEQDLPVSKLYIQEIEKLGFRIISQSKWLNAVCVITSNKENTKKLDALNFVNKVKYLGPKSPTFDKEKMVMDEFMDKIETYKPDSSDMDKNRFYGLSTNQIAMTKVNYLHQLGFTGEGVTIAVLDAGFYKVNELDAFKYLWNTGRIADVWDFVENDSNVFDADMHGMNVLSCMSTYLPMIHIGSSYGAKYLLLRTENAANEYPIEEVWWINGAEYADSAGADIINSSLGYNEFDDVSLSYKANDLNGKTALISRAASILDSKGIILCNSAGNSGSDNWKFIGVPADASDILSVAAVDFRGNRASFSSFGRKENKYAPNIALMGKDVAVVSGNNGFKPADGTSFSSPLLCGMTACLMQAFPNSSPKEIREAIIQSANRYKNPDLEYGYGIPDFALAYFILSEKTGKKIETSVLGNPIIEENKLKINFYAKNKGKYTLKIFDNQGNVIREIKVKIKKPGLQTLELAELNLKSTKDLSLSVEYKNEIQKGIKIVSNQAD